jgi:hypothetical protein
VIAAALLAVNTLIEWPAGEVDAGADNTMVRILQPAGVRGAAGARIRGIETDPEVADYAAGMQLGAATLADTIQAGFARAAFAIAGAGGIAGLQAGAIGTALQPGRTGVLVRAEADGIAGNAFASTAVIIHIAIGRGFANEVSANADLTHGGIVEPAVGRGTAGAFDGQIEADLDIINDAATPGPFAAGAPAIHAGLAGS